MRRLPVLTERRAFLLGLVGTVGAVAAAAGCTSESDAIQPRGSSGGSSGQRPARDAGLDGGPGDADIEEGGTPPNPAQDAGKDAAADAATTPGCTVVGVDAGGPPASFTMGTLTYVAAANAYIGRDAGGLYGMYALCTHSVGSFAVGANQLTCLVHGARFNFVGAVLQGPANMPLPHFAICLNSKGNVAVDPNVIVASSTRLNM